MRLNKGLVVLWRGGGQGGGGLQKQECGGGGGMSSFTSKIKREGEGKCLTHAEGGHKRFGVCFNVGQVLATLS